MNVPLPAASGQFPPDGAGDVLVIGNAMMGHFAPTHHGAAGSMFDFQDEDPIGFNYWGRPALFGSYSYFGIRNGDILVRRGHDMTFTHNNSVTSARGLVVGG